MRTFLFPILLATGIAPSLPAQTSNVRLAFDLEKAKIPISSLPSQGVELNGKCFFAATTLEHGRELWVKDRNGVSLFRDIRPGPESSNPTELILCNNRIFFVANDGRRGVELWTTNGTANATRIVADLEPGRASSLPQQLTCCRGKLFFSAFDCKRGRELHVSNGTSAGTRLVKDKNFGPASSMGRGPIVCCRNFAFFFANDGRHGFELWRSDGTLPGTVLVKDLVDGPSDGVDTNQLVCCKGKVFFVGRPLATGRELYSSNGTASGTVLVADLFPGRTGSGPRHLTCCNDVLYFSTFGLVNNTRIGQELWKSDGTTAGTVLVKDLRPGSLSSFPSQFICCDGKVFFTATTGLGSELWKTDGTAAGTVIVKDIVAGSGGSFPGFLHCCNKTLFFVARTPAAGSELWKSDGTAAGTVLVKDLTPGTASSSFRAIWCCGGKVQLTAFGSGIGFELFESDGTSAGTKLLKDIEPAVRTLSSSVANLTCALPFGLYFTARTVADGNDLFFFDGKNIISQNIADGDKSSNPSGLVWNGKALLSSATGPLGRKLYRSVPGQGTQVVSDKRGPIANPRQLTRVGQSDTVVFTVSDGEIGTEFGKVVGDARDAVTFDYNKGRGSSSPEIEQVSFPAAHGKAFLIANDGTNNREPIEIATDNTIRTLDLNANSTSSRGTFTTSVGSVLAGVEGVNAKRERTLFVYDPNKNRKVLQELSLNVNSNDIDVDQVFARKKGTLTIIVTGLELAPTSLGEQLYEFTPAGQMKLLHRINPRGGSQIEEFTPLGDQLFFRATDGKHGSELWCLDLNTKKLKMFDVLPGIEGSFPRSLKVIGCRVWFVAQGSDISDVDIWSSDGVTIRKEVDNDSRISQNTSASREITCCCGEVWFPAYTKTAGVELLVRSRPGPTVETIGAPCGKTAPVATASAPVLGGVMTLRGFDGPTGSAGVLFLDAFGKQRTRVFGCDLWINLAAAFPLGVVAAPTYAVGVPIPTDPRLTGLKLTQQTLWLPASVVPFVATNGLLLSLGACK